MKIALSIAVLATTFGGCAVVPVGPPVAYVAPRFVVAAPAVVVRPYYYRSWDRY